MSYTAIVCKLNNVRKHPNADRLQLAEANGYTVIVGLDNHEGQLGIYFPCDGQLSEEYTTANNLVGYTDPATGEHAGGFFSKNRRIRALRLRGEKSDGYWATLDTLHFIDGVSEATILMKEGDQFDAINNVKICEKYFTPATLRAMKFETKKNHVNTYFAKHVETGQFLREDRNIPGGSIIYITEKLHGTSGRFGYVLDEKEKMPWDRKFVNKVLKTLRIKKKLFPDIHVEWDHLLGTRNVIMDKWEGQSYYGDEGFRRSSVKKLEGQLFKGEIIYYELVGWTDTGTPIMPPVDLSVIKDKALQKQYPKQMFYSYGCNPKGGGEHELYPQFDLYVYRITRVTDDGHVTELSWPQVKARCEQLGIKYVPHLDGPIVYDGNTMWSKVVEEYSEGTSTIDSRHIREGVCLRIETPRGDTYFLKNKSFSFKILEGMIKESDSYIDMEEIA